MAITNTEDAARASERPKSLSPASLLQRAGIGLLIMCLATSASLWLYDASNRANALSKQTDAPAPVTRIIASGR